jgi:hypothetical protein
MVILTFSAFRAIEITAEFSCQNGDNDEWLDLVSAIVAPEAYEKLAIARRRLWSDVSRRLFVSADSVLIAVEPRL